MLSLRKPGLEFRSLCLEGSVISFISLCAQRWPKTPLISFHIEHVVINPSIPTDTLSPFKHCRVTLKILPERQFRLNETSDHFIQGEGGGRGRGRPLAVGMIQYTA